MLPTANRRKSLILLGNSRFRPGSWRVARTIRKRAPMRLGASVSSDLLVTQDPDPQARNARITKVLRTLGERSTLRQTKA